jgi:hypothetical protein
MEVAEKQPRLCSCKCHRPTGYMEVCRECCVRSAKDEAFETMMAMNKTVLGLEEKCKKAQGVIVALIEECGAMIHDEEDCPEDDTCSCPMAKRVKEALQGFEE